MSARSINIHWWRFWKDLLTDRRARSVPDVPANSINFYSPWGNWHLFSFGTKHFDFHWQLECSVMEIIFWISLISLTLFILLHWVIPFERRIFFYSSSSWRRSNLLMWRKKCDMKPAPPELGYCIILDTWCSIHNFTFMCFSLAVIPVKVIIFCVTVAVPDTERQFAMFTWSVVLTHPPYPYPDLRPLKLRAR